jgi:hypothetical protein
MSHYRETFLWIGLGVFALAVLGGISQVLSRWMGLPVLVIFPVIAGVAAVLVTAIWVRNP